MNKFSNFIFPLSYVGKWRSCWKSRKSTRICVTNLFVLDFLKVKEARFERAEGSLGDLGSKKSKLSQRERLLKGCWQSSQAAMST